MRPGDYDPEAAKRQVELSSPDVRYYVQSLRETVDAATAEIVRLHQVIDRHTSEASRAVIEYHDVLPAITTIDMDCMRTLVRVKPREREFYLYGSMGGYSEDHRRAFHKQVVAGFSHKSADDIARSIWSARERP